jgi:hypothetical protein
VFLSVVLGGLRATQGRLGEAAGASQQSPLVRWFSIGGSGVIGGAWVERWEYEL